MAAGLMSGLFGATDTPGFGMNNHNDIQFGSTCIRSSV